MDLLKPRTIFAIRLRLLAWLLVNLTIVYHLLDFKHELFPFIKNIVYSFKESVDKSSVIIIFVLFILILLPVLIFFVIKSVSLIFEFIFAFLKADADSCNTLIKNLKDEKDGIIFNYIRCLADQKREIYYYESEYINDKINKKSKDELEKKTKAIQKSERQEQDRHARRELETEFLKIKEKKQQ